MSESRKLRASASPPVARCGAGDISERELSRERCALQTTPPPRVRVHPKKQLFSVPVSKFTAKGSSPSPNLKRIKSCLDELHQQATPTRPGQVVPKAVSMEDLTPTKRMKTGNHGQLPLRRWSGLPGPAQQQAARVISHFMVLSAWRRRRDEVKCLRRTLESQVGCSERLRAQVYALKSLLDSDNAKVRLAMRELERLKQLLCDKETEKTLLEREKSALEGDVNAAEDKASEMSIGWRNCRNELEGARAAAAACEAALQQERAAVAAARAQRDQAREQVRNLERSASDRAARLTAAAARVAALRADNERTRAQLDDAHAQLKEEQEARARLAEQGAALSARVAKGAGETAALRGALAALQAEVARLDAALALTRRQLAWWPAPLTRLVGAARSWCGRVSLTEALLWSVLPARHGC